MIPSGIVPLRAFARRLLAGIGRGAIRSGPGTASADGHAIPRAAYKEVWDALAATESGAKLAVAGSTDEGLLRQTAERTRDALLTSVAIRPDDVVLEIGAGVGRMGEVVATLCRQWIGTDVSENMLAHLRRRLAALPNVAAVALSGYDLAPIASGSVDLVYCTVVFMHLDEWERFGYVREAMRVLRPGGRLWVDNFDLCTDAGWELFLRTGSAFDPLHRPPYVSKASTPPELATYFARAGFERIDQRHDGMWIITYGWKPGQRGDGT